MNFIVHFPAWLLLLLLSSVAVASAAAASSRPWVIAHRGASGVLPGLTLAALRRGIQDGADAVEIDLCLTSDKQLVVLHDLELSKSTDVAFRPLFKNRRRTVLVTNNERPPSHHNVTDWLVHDFTLAELKTLRKVQPFAFRDDAYNGRFTIPTLKEALQLVASNSEHAKLVIELKLPVYFGQFFKQRHIMEDAVLKEIRAEPQILGHQRVLLQSFEESAVGYFLKQANDVDSRHDIYQIVDSSAGLSDELMRQWTKQGLRGLTLNKNMVATGPPNPKQKAKYNVTASLPSKLVTQAHSLGLKVFVWTLRNEDRYLAWSFGQDPAAEVEWLDRAKVDGLISDFPASVKRTLDIRYDNGGRATGSRAPSTLLLACAVLAMRCFGI